MNIAMIIAGGVGSRMGNVIPKQFLPVNNQPVIVYTMEEFQYHPLVDVICVVCLSGWADTVWSCKNEYGLSKLQHVITGGNNGQQSIEKGLFALETLYPRDSLVLMHEAVRPLVTEEIITDCIATAEKYGSATVAVPSPDVVMRTENGICSSEEVPRDYLRKTQVPQAFSIGNGCGLYREAKQKGISNSATTCTLMASLGKTVFFSKGSSLNFKLTTPEDLELFKAILQTQVDQENNQ